MHVPQLSSLRRATHMHAYARNCERGQRRFLELLSVRRGAVHQCRRDQALPDSATNGGDQLGSRVGLPTISV